MRQDPPFDFEYVAATWLLERAQAGGARVFNGRVRCATTPRSWRSPSSRSSPRPRWWRAIRPHPGLHRRAGRRHPQAARRHGRQPASSASARRPQPQRHRRDADRHDGARSIMAQRYLPEIAQGDKRILLIGGEPVPFALARIPKAGETRGNLAAGGSGVAQPLSARDREIAEHLAPILGARPPARRPRRHRRLPHRDQRHQPDLLRRDRPADRLRRRRRCSSMPWSVHAALRPALLCSRSAAGGLLRGRRNCTSASLRLRHPRRVSVWGVGRPGAQALAAVLPSSTACTACCTPGSLPS
jgi:hypothetical protein